MAGWNVDGGTVGAAILKEVSAGFNMKQWNLFVWEGLTKRRLWSNKNDHYPWGKSLQE
jgi:hypothetical protein